jgi:hypothetical protein
MYLLDDLEGFIVFYRGRLRRDLVYRRVRIPGSQPTYELIQRRRSPLRFSFNGTIDAIRHPTGKAQRFGRFFSEPTKPDALNPTDNDYM